uniref:Ribonuclease A-domain domain-containing protein n=1 Tax=Pygocentrus nattereri TaxID=42514 RepID=A0AAR2KV27_PYGNA
MDALSEKEFEAKHIGLNKDLKDCNIIMKNISKCKKVNTFILATIGKVRSVCSEGKRLPNENTKGKVRLDFFESTNMFDKVVCYKDKHKCLYTRKEEQGPIAVGCDQNKHPVHYGLEDKDPSLSR